MLGSEDKLFLDLWLAIPYRSTPCEVVEQVRLRTTYFKFDRRWAGYVQLVTIAFQTASLQILFKKTDLITTKQSGSATWQPLVKGFCERTLAHKIHFCFYQLE